MVILRDRKGRDGQYQHYKIMNENIKDMFKGIKKILKISQKNKILRGKKKI